MTDTPHAPASGHDLPATSRPLKVMLFPLGWLLSHVGRLVEIGKELRARGHDVWFVGADPDQPRSKLGMARAAGFPILRAPEPDYPYAWDRFEKYGWLATGWDLLHLRRWAPLDCILEAHVELMRRERPDLVVGDGTVTVSTAACIAGVPAAGVMNAYCGHFMNTTSVYMPLIRTWDRLHLARIRRPVFAHYGAEPVDALRVVMGMPLLSPDLPGLYAPPRGWARWEMVGPILSEPPVSAPDWIGELDDGTPTVYITMGSTGFLDSFLRRCYDALGRLPCRFVVTTGGQVRPETEALAPPNFRLAPYASGSHILARAEALIFHGGNGTMYQALAAGVPMLALPCHLEQDLCADMVVRHGFGLRLAPRRVNGPAVVTALECLMHETRFREAAQRYSEAVRTANGALRAAEVLERVARDGVRAAPPRS